MPQSHSVKTRDNSPSRTFNKLFYGLGLLSIIAVALAVSVLSQAAGERGKRAARNSAATERVNVRQKSPAHAAANAFLAAPMATITVDRTDDVPSASGCTGAPSDCSLRGAVTFANLNPGTTISVPAGTYQLTIDGGFVEGFNGDNSVGDLDITANNTAIIGASAASTIIQQTRPNDRVIEVNPFLDAGLVTTISDVTITGGRETTGVGGGGIISGSINNDLSITNCIISGNSATGAGSFGGGGISHLGGDLDISGTTFSGNSTTSSGGAVGYSAGDPLGRTPSAGTLSVSGSTFSGNTAGSVAAGGGALDLFDFNLSTGTYSINSSSFSGNSATNGNGGAIVVESGPLTATTSSFTSNSAGNRGGAIYSSGSASVAYSRLVGNSVPVAANGLTLFRANTSFTADDNWWGSNSGPGANDFRATDGSVSPATYLQLRISASPTELCPNETSTLTADIKQRNAGSPLTTELNGLPAFPTPAATIFNNASLGTLSGASTQFVNGVATATYTAGNTPGNGGADATADNQTVSATIIVRTAEATDPADQAVCQGDTAVFSTTASGSGPFTYAWTLDGSPFGGNTDSISVPTGSLSIGAHTVTVTVSSSCGSITHSATLNVQEPTSTSDPTDQTVCQGADAMFSTTASGTGPFSYAWKLDGAPFGGDTSSITVSTGALSVGVHTVEVTVTGACGSATQSATLTVQENTSTTDPADQTVCEDDDATFSTTASGTGPFTYAWKLDGAPFGGNTSSITVPGGSQSVGVHTVEVTVTGACGSATQSATLTVQESTSTTDPADQTVCQGADATFSTTASGTGPFSYAWTLDGNSIGGDSASLTVPTGSLSVGVHTVVVTVTGTCGTATQTATLTVQENTAASDPADQTVCQGTDAIFSTTASGTNIHYAWTLDGNPFGGDTASITVPTGSLSVGSHTVGLTVSGECGTVTHTASLTVQENTSTTDPPDQIVCQGTDATFSTTASGTGPFSYAWTLDGNAVGGNTSSVTIPTGSLSIGDHTVTVTVTGTCGSATQSATLTVRQLTSTTDPSDVAACQGGMAAFSTTASGTGPFTFVWKKGAAIINHGDFGGRVSITNTTTGSTLVISNVQAGDAGGYTVETTGACNTATQDFNLTVDSAPPVIVLNPQIITLWPPNHSYHTINVSQVVSSVSDSCDTGLGVGSVVITSVSSDEPENGNGDGNTVNDIVIAADCKSVQLRAERQGGGNGRVYRINMKVTDSSGNTTTATAKVQVPKNANSQAIDNGPAAGYTVTSNCP